MRNEVRLEHVQAEHDARVRALEHFESTERAFQRQEYQDIKTDVSPRSYEEKLDWLHARRCDGTGRWLKRDAAFAKWLDITDTSTKVLWLQGIPGSGVYQSNNPYQSLRIIMITHRKDIPVSYGCRRDKGPWSYSLRFPQPHLFQLRLGAIDTSLFNIPAGFQ